MVFPWPLFATWGFCCYLTYYHMRLLIYSLFCFLSRTLTQVLQMHIEMADKAERNMEEKRDRLIKYFKVRALLIFLHIAGDTLAVYFKLDKIWQSYMDEWFNYSSVSKSVINDNLSCYQMWITFSHQLFQAAEYIVKFIVRSRKLSELSAPGKGRHEFEVSLNGLFSAVVKMMLNTSNDALLVQVKKSF